MPTYEYKCDACGHDFEKFHSITAPPIRKCPVCKKNKVRRLLSTGAGLIFKGSGFYITDYRSDSYKSAAKSDSAGNGESKPATTTDAKGDSKTETKTESKSETKTESKPAAKPEKPPAARSSSAKRTSAKS